MYNINFVKASKALKEGIIAGKFTGDAFGELEKLRSRKPYIFQVETTNLCNLTCVMCPRTTEMERKLGTMQVSDFKTIIDQLEPHSEDEWNEWLKFVETDCMVNAKALEEDYFYFMICAKTLIMHGFGEPVLDKTLAEKIALASKKNIPTYFSMNPVNIKLDKLDALGKAGLGYLKFSLEGLDNDTQKYYRGRTDKSFDITLNKVMEAIELFQKKGYKTKIILTRLNFKDDFEEQQKYIDFWKQYPVMVYVKNQHNRWLYEEDGAPDNSAEYMQRYCEFPWASTSVLENGTVVPCPLEYDGKLNMGNIKDQSLEEIWNGKKYRDLRKMHATGCFPKDHFCVKNCDYHHLHEFIKRNREAQGKGA